MAHFKIIVLLTLGVIFIVPLSIIVKHGSIEQVVYGEYAVINDIKCDKTEHFNFHYHAHLNIFIKGFSYLVSANIGNNLPDCIYWLHTHDTSGIIHVESPENKTFTVGQFFDIWGKKFDNSQILNFTVNKSENSTLAVHINGTLVHDIQYRSIPIKDHEDIVIVYGKPPKDLGAYSFLY